MKQLEQFWQHVASDIQKNYQKGHPSQWKQGKINRFLVHFEDKLKERCQENEKLIKGLDLFVKDGEVQFNGMRVPSYYTFHRIFKKKTSTGSYFYQNQFAIYLGYDSFENYATAKGLQGLLEDATDKEKNSEREKEQDLTQQDLEAGRAIFIKNALLKSFKWMIIWLTGSQLVHNIIGTFKDIPISKWWYYIFWLPPIVVGLIVHYFGKQVIKRKEEKVMFLSVIWWIGIGSQIFINQYIPNYLHVIEATSIFIIGIIGQIGLSSQLVFIANDILAWQNQKHQFIRLFEYNLNLAVFTYIIGIFFGLLLAAFIWVIPSEHIRTHFEHVETFRLVRTLEIIIGIILISIGVRKLIFKPILFFNTRQS